MPKPAFPSLACVPSDATISSTSSIGHSGKNDGCRSAPLDALPPPSNRPCALSRKHQSFGPASETSGQKSAKSSYGGDLFIFRGRRGDLIKIVWYDGQGACLFTKRLEWGRFIWPSIADGVVTISTAQMAYLLDGIDWRMPRKTWRPRVAG